MNEEEKETKQSNKKIAGKKKLYASIAAMLAVAVLIAGLSYAWFYNRTNMATLLAIRPPSSIAILGPHGSEMTSLDLNYTNKDKDADGKVTIRRVICVQSGVDISAYKLEIVHTTNLKGLTFKLYPATEVENTENNSVTDGGYTYEYDLNQQISGEYINQNTSSGDYKYADNTQHAKNYGTYDNVQTHAEPLYWLANSSLTPTRREEDRVIVEDQAYNRTYYVCEVSWAEDTKETDIFYILVKTASE